MHLRATAKKKPFIWWPIFATFVHIKHNDSHKNCGDFCRWERASKNNMNIFVITVRKKIKWKLCAIWSAPARRRALNLFNRWNADVNVMPGSTAGRRITLPMLHWQQGQMCQHFHQITQFYSFNVIYRRDVRIKRITIVMSVLRFSVCTELTWFSLTCTLNNTKQAFEMWRMVFCAFVSGISSQVAYDDIIKNLSTYNIPGI